MTTITQATPTKPPESDRPPAEDAVLKALSAQPEATAADLATAAGLGRSTVSKTLARLEQAGQVHRHGRDGARRLPDRWALASPEPTADTAPEERIVSAEATAPTSNTERLKPGELEGLILTYLQEHPAEPVGPGAVAKALQRSSGATANCLARLTKARKVQQVNDKPRRYSLPA